MIGASKSTVDALFLGREKRSCSKPRVSREAERARARLNAEWSNGIAKENGFFLVAPRTS